MPFKCLYNPNKNISNHLERFNFFIQISLDLYSAQYENVILVGDFNVHPESHIWKRLVNLIG